MKMTRRTLRSGVYWQEVLNIKGAKQGLCVVWKIDTNASGESDASIF
jgi:hypothetical protein